MSAKKLAEIEKKKVEEKYSGDLEWIKFREETLGDYAYDEETSGEKFFRKMRDNPFVPIGSLATVFALCYGLKAFKQGNMKKSQVGMRLRIGAQGFTIVALLAGIFLGVGGDKLGTKSANSNSDQLGPEGRNLGPKTLAKPQPQQVVVLEKK